MKKYLPLFLVAASQSLFASPLYVSSVSLGPVSCSIEDGAWIAQAQRQATQKAFDHLFNQGCRRPIQVSLWRSQAHAKGWPYAPEICRSKWVGATASFGCEDDVSGFTVHTTGVDESPYGAQREAENAAAFYCNVETAMIRRVSDWQMVHSPYGAATASATFSCGY